MHVRDLIEVAAMIAAHGPVLIEGDAGISVTALEQYWTASKCRLDRWLRALKKFASQQGGEPAERKLLEAEIRAVLEEILIAEIPLRLWTATLYAYDRRRQSDDAEPIARSVFLGHLDIRQRALALLIHSPNIDARGAVELNRLRRRAERWTDLLLGCLSQDNPPCELAFEPERCREFCAELRHGQRQAINGQAWRLTVASLRIAFQTGLSQRCPNADLNHDIAGSILACFPPELFDSTGTVQSLWLVRMSHAADDAQGMIDQLLAPEPATAHSRDNLPGARASDGRTLRFRGDLS